MNETDWENKFHRHLDACNQCRENPFGLCPIGEHYLKMSVLRPRKNEAIDSKDQSK